MNLSIYNGHYEQIITNEQKINYAIEFEYRVTGGNCSIGGYSIQWNADKSVQIDWYVMQKLQAGKTYSISDTFRVDAEIIGNPLLQMQGYLDCCSEADSRLMAKFYLERK